MMNQQKRCPAPASLEALAYIPETKSFLMPGGQFIEEKQFGEANALKMKKKAKSYKVLNEIVPMSGTVVNESPNKKAPIT